MQFSKELFVKYNEWLHTLCEHPRHLEDRNNFRIEENINNLNLPMITNKNIDTVYLARKYIKGVYNHKLETLKNYFRLTYSSHRSIEDCLTTNHVYQYCKSIYKNPLLANNGSKGIFLVSFKIEIGADMLCLLQTFHQP